MANSCDSDVQVLEKNDVFDILEEKWDVVFYNDDETTFEFVIHLLREDFHMNEAHAFQLTQRIHVQGRGVAGTYPYTVAYEKVFRAREKARLAGFPLRIEMEQQV